MKNVMSFACLLIMLVSCVGNQDGYQKEDESPADSHLRTVKEVLIIAQDAAFMLEDSEISRVGHQDLSDALYYTISR